MNNGEIAMRNGVLPKMATTRPQKVTRLRKPSLSFNRKKWLTGVLVCGLFASSPVGLPLLGDTISAPVSLTSIADSPDLFNESPSAPYPQLAQNFPQNGMPTVRLTSGSAEESVPELGGVQTAPAAGGTPMPAAPETQPAPPPVTPNATDGSLVQGLTLLTSSDGPQTGAGALDPTAGQPAPEGQVTSTLPELPMDENGNPILSGFEGSGEILFPGKIRELKLGASKVGTLSLTIRWFQSSEIGLSPESDGKIKIERANSPEGPWKLVAPDAQGISSRQPGYWFAVSRDEEKTPFYLRVVMVDSLNKEWVDMVPNPININAPPPAQNKDSAQKSSGEQRSDFSQVAYEQDMPSYQSQMSGGSSGNSSASSSDSPWKGGTLNESETRDLTAALDQNRSSGSSSYRSPTYSPDPQTSGSKKRAHRQPLTDQSQMTLNPLFTLGFGVFGGGGETRVDAAYPGVDNPGDYPAPNSGGHQSSAPAKPPKRSVFMSPQEYRDEVAAQEYEENLYAQQQRAIEAQRPRTSGVIGWNDTGGGQSLYSDPYGNQVQNGYQNMPQVIYQDANGNVIDNPFPNGQFQGMPIVGGPMQSGYPQGGYSQGGYSQNGVPVDAYTGNAYMGNTYTDNGMLTMPVDNNYGASFDNVSFDINQASGSFVTPSSSGPYTNQETISGAGANLPGPTQTPITSNSLPPRPGTK